MISYQKNQILGNNFKLIKEIEPFIRKDGYKRRVAIFLCPKCKKEFETRIENIKDKKRMQSCGCEKNKLISKARTKHGMTGTSLYFVWHNMKVRCYNRNNSHYKWYGARGISICEEWKNNFENFYKFAVENGWEKGLEIDRTNNDGNYTPENVRFVTRKENMNNTRELNKRNTSGYKNIRRYMDNRFRVVVKGKHIGIYNTIEEAITARDEYKTHYTTK